MRGLGIVELCKTVSTTHFTDALTVGQGENETIAAKDLRMKKAGIVNVTIVSVQNLDYELHFFEGPTFGHATIDSDTYLGMVELKLSTLGKLLGEAGIGHYYLSVQLAAPLFIRGTTDAMSLYMRLVNRSATAKITGASGAVVVRVQADTGIR